MKAGRAVGHEVKRFGLSLSDKSTRLPDNHVTRSVAKVLVSEGVTLKTASTGDDVGIQMSGSLVRTASSLNKRINAKGADIAKRTNALVSINRSALK